ncbi:MAG: hypothetical protein WBA99_03155 [Nodosilinea sp.]
MANLLGLLLVQLLAVRLALLSPAWVTSLVLVLVRLSVRSAGGWLAVRSVARSVAASVAP